MSSDGLDKTLITESDAGASLEQTVIGEKLPFERLGEFRIVSKLGAGGMGDVFLGIQESLDRKVAIKTLKQEIAERPESVERFQREARAMARIDHPNMVNCYAVGCDQDTHFLAIEFIDGDTLRGILQRHGPLDVDNALCIAHKAGDMLRVAHQSDMIHRDIKPENILISREGQVKVADFGLAKAIDEDVALTQSGTGMGTPLYMPLEQIHNAKHVDQRADIYALGATLYHCLSGVPPFKQPSLVELINAKKRGQFPALRQQNPNVSDRFGLIIDKMLAVDPTHRYQKMDDVLRDLDSVGRGCEMFAWPGTPASQMRKASVPTAATIGSQPSIRPQSFPQPDTVTNHSETTLTAEDEPQWQVCFAGKDGKSVFKTLPESKLRDYVRSKKIPIKADARPVGASGFKRLTAYEEFSELGSLVKTVQLATKDVIRNQDEIRQRREEAAKTKFYEQSWFYGAALAVVIAVVVWLSWPMSDAQKFARGEALFKSDDAADRMEAVDRYFRPLVAEGPESDVALLAQEMIDEYEAEVAGKRLERMLERSRVPEREAEQIYLLARRQEKFGDSAAAVRTLESLAEQFAGSEDDRPVVNLSRQQITLLQGPDSELPTSREVVIDALRRARAADQRLDSFEARKIWTTLTELYAGRTDVQPLIEYAGQRQSGIKPEQTLEELIEQSEPKPAVTDETASDSAETVTESQSLEL
ncbi:MAG: serine/threonine-protein kinase [Planctomycetota bacterium]|jgi:serine/threonine-protein kinase